MSDILIKNMKMPDCCFKCPFKNHDGMWVRCIITGQNVEPETRRETKASSCPLIELQPHGRLIDADELHKKAFQRAEKIGDYYNCMDFVISAFDIENAQTIIPAVSEEREG